MFLGLTAANTHQNSMYGAFVFCGAGLHQCVVHQMSLLKWRATLHDFACTTSDKFLIND